MVRHARAEQSAATDLERRLLPRGAADAMDAGRWLSGEGVVPDAALVSAAMRAQETWASLAIGLGTDVEPQVERGLYTADPETALDLVRLTDNGAQTLAVVGHNPTVASLASLLDDGEGDPSAAVAMVMGFPPGALALFEYAGSWASLAWGGARLTAFHPPRY